MIQTNAQIPVASGLFDVNLRDFAAPLFRHQRLLITSLLLLFAGIMLYFVATGPVYPAHMSILVNRERLDPLVSTETTSQVVTANDPVTQEEINSEVELLSSRDVLEKVVLQNSLQVPSGFAAVIAKLTPWQTNEDRLARAVRSLAKQIKITVVKDSDVIDITFKSSNPQLSASVLKSLGDFYMAKHVEVHSSAGSYEFFAAETQKYQNEMNDAEDKLRKFDRQNSTAAPGEQRTQLASQVATSVGILHQSGEAIAADEDRIKEDQHQIGQTPPRSTTVLSSAFNDKLIDDLQAALLAAQLKRTNLAMKYDASYPLVQEADKEISQAQSALNKAEQTKYVTESTDKDPTFELLREDVAKTEADLATQRATYRATEQSIQSIQGMMVDLDQLSLSQGDLQRDMRAAESNYLLYLGKREQERSSNALDITRISNVAIAIPPAVPVLPQFGWPMMVLIAFGIAMVLGIGAAYTVDYFDPTFHTPGQVVDMLGIPIVVAVSEKVA
jgi:uncharacterized protein involved in exopolysaccharide biosynthesis